MVSEGAMNLEQAIEVILSDRGPIEDFDPRCLGLEFEKGGADAFDRTIQHLREAGIGEEAIVRGLRALALLTRHFAISRKGELLEFAIVMLEHPSELVRSAALIVTVVTAKTVRNLAPGQLGRCVSAEAIQEAVRRALERGVDAERDTLGRRFLKSGGDTTATEE
jgi:hypothetical protein